jgi:putative flippase GtrA
VKAALREAVRFGLVGLSNAALSYGAFRFLLSALGGFPGAAALAQGCGFALGMGWSYVWNRIWTFGSKSVVAPEGARFVALQLTLLALSSAGVEAALAAGLGKILGWISVMTPITLMNFLGMRFWVYARTGLQGH